MAVRELHYSVEGKVANLRTFAMDNQSDGGANHWYKIESPENIVDGVGNMPRVQEHIRFQKGPINADGNGINGIQNEDLLAIVIDRLEGFQSGPFACHANKQALDFCRCAMSALQDRTRERIKRGVEGTHKL
jgi:hypothetical protein